MLCLQVCLLILGIVLMTKRQIRVGGQVAKTPTPFFMGLALTLQFPVALMLGFFVGVSEGMEAAKKGKTQMSKADIANIQAKYWWMDVAIPTAGAAAAGVILALGLKDPEPRRRRPLDDVFAGPGPDDADDPRYPSEYGGRASY